MEFFTDGTAMFEAFTSGLLTTMRETNAANWAENYDFPRVQSGGGGSVGSAPPPAFGDHRAGDEHTPRRLRRLARPRGDDPGLQLRIHQPDAQRRDRSRASPPISPTRRWACSPDRPRAGWRNSSNPSQAIFCPARSRATSCRSRTGRSANRAGIAEALRLMEEAGYTVEEGVMTGPDGAPFTFDILLQSGSSENEAIVNIYVEALERLGITPSVQLRRSGPVSRAHGCLRFRHDDLPAGPVAQPRQRAAALLGL